MFILFLFADFASKEADSKVPSGLRDLRFVESNLHSFAGDTARRCRCHFEQNESLSNQ